jgi:hypothetical protein
MSFDPRKLPAGVYQAFRQGPMAWPLVVQRAIQAGIRDTDKLTDIVFFLHHPERAGRALAPHEGALINQWKSFRNLVQPSVASGGSSLPPSPWGTEREIYYDPKTGKWNYK